MWGPRIVPDKEYAPLEAVVVALELSSASKRLPGSDTPQGNTKLLGPWTVLSKGIYEQVIMGRTRACLSYTQNDLDLL